MCSFSKIFKLALVFLFISIFPFKKLFAQKDNIRFERIGTFEGLSNRTVNSIVQDSDGFIWFATDDGLNKFNGYGFTVYYHSNDDPFSVPANRVRSIYLDKKGRLWVGSGNGLSYYDKYHDKFINYLPGYYVRHISEDSDGSLWLGTNKALINFNPETKKETLYSIMNGNEVPKESNIICTKTDHEGMVWLGTDGAGVFRFDKNSKKFTNYLQSNLENSLSHNIVLSIYEDSKQRLWFGTKNGLNRFDRENDNFIVYKKTNYAVNSNLIFTIAEDNDGLLWIGSYDGISKFNPETSISINYSHQKNNILSLSTNLIRSIYISKNNIIWIGTRDGGINKFNKNKEAFIVYDKFYNKNLTTNNLTCVSEDDNENLWIGTKDRGLFYYDRKTDSFRNYVNEPNNPSSLSHNNILSILIDSEQNLWAGTYGGGLNSFNKRTGTFTKYKNIPGNLKSISNDVIQWLFEDSQGILWVCTDGGGLNKFDKESKTFTRYLYDKDNPNSISENTVLAICEDRETNLWIGTENGGLNYFNKETETFSRYLLQPVNNTTIKRVYSIAMDYQNNLWLGTEAGLTKFDPVTKNLIQYTVNDGLPGNIIYGVLIDENENLWVSTKRGLSKFNPQTSNFKNYNFEDGLQGNDFEINNYHKGKSGKFYFGGSNGLTEFYPSNVQDNTQISAVVISGFEVFDQSISPKDSTFLEKHINFTDQITLDYTDYIFSFTFSALNYTWPSKIKFMYKLEGFDRDWVRTDNKLRKATYTNLPPGKYDFRVKASNENGYWNNEREPIRVIILPPFWQTLWFYSLLVLAAGVLVYSFVRYKINKILELERLRMSIASDLHDDIGSTLTKLALKADITKQEVQSETANKSLERISEMSRYAVSTMSDIVWSIDSRNDSFESMLNKMKDFTYGLLSDKEINVEFYSSGFDSAKKAPISFRQNLYLILKEAVNNISKHSNADQVKIDLKLSENKYSLLVQDNGSIFEEKEFKVGHGMKNMRLRADKINAVIDFNKENGFKVFVAGKL